MLNNEKRKNKGSTLKKEKQRKHFEKGKSCSENWLRQYQIVLPELYLLFIFIYVFIYLFICFFRATLSVYGSSQTRGRIGATAAGLHRSHSNTGSLTHWARPGIEPTSSWILLSLLTTEPWRELLNSTFSLKWELTLFFIIIFVKNTLPNQHKGTKFNTWHVADTQ